MRGTEQRADAWAQQAIKTRQTKAIVRMAPSQD
jgi:hypothetical protein